MEKVGVEAVVEGLGLFLDGMKDMDQGIQSLIPSTGLLGSAFSAFGDIIGGVASFISNTLSHAIGEILADAVQWAAQQINELISSMFEFANELQRLEIRLTGLNLPASTADITDWDEAMKEAGKATEQQLEWLQQLSVASPFDPQKIADIYTAARAMGYADEAARELTTDILEFGAGMGLSNEQVERIIVNFRQMETRGKVTGREMNDLARGALVPLDDVLQRMAKNMGISVEELSKMISTADGVDADIFIKAFQEMVNEEPRFTGAMGRLGRTFQNATQNFKEFIESIGAKNIVMPVLDILGERIASIVDQFISFNEQGELIKTDKWYEVVEAATRIGEAFSSIATQLLGLLPSADGVADGIVNGLNSIADWLETHQQDIVSWVKDAAAWIQDTLIPALAQIWEWLFGMEGEPGMIEKFLRWLQDSNVSSLVQRIIDTLLAIAPVIQPIIELFGALGEVIIAAFGGDETQTFAEFVKTTLVPAIESLTNWIRDNKDMLAAALVIWLKAEVVIGIVNAAFSIIIGVIIKVISILSAAGVVFGVVSTIIKSLVGVVGLLASALGVTFAGAVAIIVAVIIVLILQIEFFILMAKYYMGLIPDVLRIVSDAFVKWKDNIVETLNNMIDRLKEGDLVGVAQAWLDGVINFLSNSKDVLVQLFTAIFDNAVEAVKWLLGIHSPSTVMWQIGVDIVAGLLNGIQTMAANLTNIMRSLIPIDAILSVNWYDVGWSIVSGIAEGISATAWWIADAAYNAARLAYEAAMAALSAGSPSKLFMKVGGWTMEGMAIGIEESAGKAAKAMTSAMERVTMPAMSAPAMATSNATQSASGSTYNTTNEYNLNISSSANTEPIIQDFSMLESLAGI